MNQEPQRRYPGLNYFTTAQKAQFFGRDEEIEELLGLILGEKIVVLFGKSGYGKSSLLRAGILPRLDKNYTPVIVQLGAYQPGQSRTPVATTIQRLGLTLPEDHPESEFLENISDPDTLWHRFKRKQTPERRRFLVIFDQFEEFDSYPAEQKNAFKQQLTELLFTRIPQLVRDRSEDLADDQQTLLAQAPEVKVLFAIREDRLSVLDTLADKLPAILHKRYRLQGMTDAQAREAVVKPAALPQNPDIENPEATPKVPKIPGKPQDQVPFGGEPVPTSREVRGGVFESPAFQYSLPALQALFRGLKKDETDPQARVESFLLQICCENIEKTVLERHQKAPGKDIQITPEDLPAFGRLFEEYYRGKIGALPDEAAQNAARRMIEDELVKADPATGIAYRINVDGRQLTKRSGVDEVLLKRLTDDFLLRSEPNTTGGFSYEVSHDRLVEGILNAKTEYEAGLALAAAERTAKEEAEQLRQEAERREQQLTATRIEADQEKRRRQRATLLAIVALVGLLVAVMAGWWALGQKAKAETAQAESQHQLVNFMREKIARQEKERADWQRKAEIFGKAERADLVQEASDSARVLLNRIETDKKQLAAQPK